MVVVLAVGTAEKGGGDAGDGGNAVAGGGGVVDDLLGGETVVVVVVVGVAHDLVAGIVEGTHRFGVFFRPVAHDEERGLYVIFRQNVDERLGVLVAPGGVEGQGAHLLRPLHGVDGELAVGGGGGDGGGDVDGAEDSGGGQRSGQQGIPAAEDEDLDVFQNDRAPFGSSYASGRDVRRRDRGRARGRAVGTGDGERL